MALISINSVDLTDIVTYEVTHKDITKEVTNVLGDTFIYVLGEKTTLKIGLGAIPQEKLALLLGALNSVTVSVTFTDLDGTAKTKTFKRSDRVNSIRSYLDSTPYWGASTITLTEI